MTNPFAAHRSDLFADRDTIDEALKYANEVFAHHNGGAAAMAVVMVLVNTAAKLWPQPVQSDPAKEITAALIRDMVDARIDQHTTSVRDMVDARIDQHTTSVRDLVDEAVSDWMHTNLKEHLSDEMEETIQDFIRNNVTISIDTI
jgi:hypothetical protein